MATPRIAVRTGIPAASSEPSVIERMTKAMMIPADSELVVDSSVTMPPPKSSSRPAARAGSALASSWSAAVSEISFAGTG
jgi:hypothetical protein